MAKRSKDTPAQIAAKLAERKRQDFEAVNLAPDTGELAKNADIEVTRAGQKRGEQKVSEDSARRLDAFEALRPSLRDAKHAGCYDAARRYEHQITVRRGENDRGPSSERVDRTAGFTTDAMIDAATWIEDVNKRLPPRDWWLLMELICPTKNLDGWCKEWVDESGHEHSIGPFSGWRATVGYITGETHSHSQGAVVRSMTVNLRDAIEVVEKAAAERRQARAAAARKAA